MDTFGGSMETRDRQMGFEVSSSLPDSWCSADIMVVMPTYQEAANLPTVVKALFDLPLSALRILVVDDNSPDGTGEIAEELATKYGQDRLGVMHRMVKDGLGRAYVAGMSRAMAAGAEFVVQMDSDLSHGPQYLPQMLGTLLSTEADVVVGSRYVAGASVDNDWPLQRKILSGFANAYVRTLLQIPIRDATAGYKLWRSSALRAIELDTIRSGGYSFQVEMSYRSVRHGLKIVEIPIHFSDRIKGESKMSFKTQLESAILPFSLRRYSFPKKEGTRLPEIVDVS